MFRIKPSYRLDLEVERVVTGRLTAIVDMLEDLGVDRDRKVHECRKHLKRLRSLLRLIRPALPSADFKLEDRCFRNAGRLLSEARSTAVLLKCFDQLLADNHVSPVDFEAHRLQLAERAKAIGSKVEGAQGAGLSRRSLDEARLRVRTWSRHVDEWPLLLRGFAETYRQGRKGLRCAVQQPNAETFHEWRKDVKHHLYQMEVLKPVLPATWKDRVDRTEIVGDLLGDDHDLHELNCALDALQHGLVAREDPRVLLGLLEQRSLALRGQAVRMGYELYTVKPKLLKAQLGRQLARLGC